MPLPRNAPAEGGQRSLRLLLIDDHVNLAEVTAEFLRQTGLEVRIAGSGEAALEEATMFRPEIVLCDIYLPDMSGFDVAQALRARENTRDAFIAIHSAMADSDLRTLRRQVNADLIDLFLSKPLTEEKVDRLLAALAARQPRSCRAK